MAMAFSHLVAIALAVSGVGAIECPLAVNLGSVGSCMFYPCAESRGPTVCTLGTCYCQEGYCRYPASTMHVQSRYCVQRVPEATCHVTRVCYSAGVTSSFCEKGLCMCKFGYHLDDDGQCVVNEPGVSLSALAGNLTLDFAEIQRKENMAVSLNVLLFCLYMTVAAMAVSGGAVLLWRNLRTQPSETEYKFLAA